MPRAALLSIHARMANADADVWEDPCLVQIWGPRYNAYVVIRQDLHLFTLGRLPDDALARARAYDTADRLRKALAGTRMKHGQAARAMQAGHPNALRYAAPTGTVLIRWDGARQADVWSIPAPDVAPSEARLELARRYLQVFGPATPASFATWAGVHLRSASAAFDALAASLMAVRTPFADAWIARRDEPLFLEAPHPAAPARLVPSGDTWFLLQGADRELLVPDETHRRALWPSRVWPGALLVDGETSGTWRRAGRWLTVTPWRRLSRAERDAVEVEARALPLSGFDQPLEVRWTEPLPGMARAATAVPAR